MEDDAWLDALLDGGQMPAGQTPAGMEKLARIQKAFFGLQWAELEPGVDRSKILFHWDHLAVLDVIGSGGFGDVYRAYDSMLQRDVALKLRKSGSRLAPATGRAFIEEARRLAQVRHPNVLAVYGAAIDDDRAGIWTDLIAGETLAKRIERQGSLSASSLLTLLTQMADALSAVHAAAMVHGDLKPSNVMCEAGQEKFILMDFGAGASLDEGGETWLGAGSLHFMAPEQANLKKLGTSADLFSLGATLLYAASKKTLRDTHAKSALNERRDLSNAFKTLVLRLLNVDPQTRPDTSELLAKCRELQGEPERRKRQRLRQAFTGALMIAVLATATGLIVSMRARAQAERESKRVTVARDFLLTMIGSPSPIQTKDPTSNMVTVFERAIARLPKTFKHDPMMQATLLRQFGLSLIALDKPEQTQLAMLRVDQLLASAGVAPTDPARIDAASDLINAYRMQRNYGQAIAVADSQAAMCEPPDSVSVRDCVGLVNDQIQAVGYGGNPTRAMQLIGQNFARATANELEKDDRVSALYLLQGAMLRDLGQSSDALASFALLIDRSLKTMQPGHPYVLFELSYLAECAGDLGDAKLARSMIDYVVAENEKLTGPNSHYTARARLLSASFALRLGDTEHVRKMAEIVRTQRLDSPLFAAYVEQATILAALADSANVSQEQLDVAEKNRLQALGELSPKLAELRLNLAAIAMRGGQWARSGQLLGQTQFVTTDENSAYLQPLYWQLMADQASRGPVPNPADTAAASAHALALVAKQQRLVFDPMTRQWIGTPPADSALNLEKIRVIAQRVYASRELAKNQHSR
jgi:serine/threonine protein kinase